MFVTYLGKYHKVKCAYIPSFLSRFSSIMLIFKLPITNINLTSDGCRDQGSAAFFHQGYCINGFSLKPINASESFLNKISNNLLLIFWGIGRQEFIEFFSRQAPSTDVCSTLPKGVKQLINVTHLKEVKKILL